MADGGSVEDYQDSKNYWGKEDYSPAGRKAMRAGDKASKTDDYVPTSPSALGNAMVSKARIKAAKNAIAEDRDQVKTMSNVDAMGNAMKKGGRVTKKVGTVKKNK